MCAIAREKIEEYQTRRVGKFLPLAIAKMRKRGLWGVLSPFWKLDRDPSIEEVDHYFSDRDILGPWVHENPSRYIRKCNDLIEKVLVFENAANKDQDIYLSYKDYRGLEDPITYWL